MADTTEGVAPNLAADTLAVLGAFIDMVRHTDRYPTKDDLGDERTTECLEWARKCVRQAEWVRLAADQKSFDFRIDLPKDIHLFGDPIAEGCKHVMTGGCPFLCFQGPCVYEANSEEAPA